MLIQERKCESVPFFRPSISEAEIAEVVACLRSGWLTTGPRAKEFETRFAEAVQARHAVALNSCTAALHLAVEALGLRAGQGVLVPTMTFAATAEIVRYQGAIPILVDCLDDSLNMDLDDAALKLKQLRSGQLGYDQAMEVVGIIPVHIGGLMLDMHAVNRFAQEHGLWVVEDAAHAFPAAMRTGRSEPWQYCGGGTSSVTCFSFYTNKTITTGEGGMVTTEDDALVDRIRQMSLHGLSRDAWTRYSGGSSWDYRIMAPGYKYNLTDIAASLGLHQLQRAEELRQKRELIAHAYTLAFEELPQLELPGASEDRLHAWHLYPIRLRLDRLSIDRNRFIDLLREQGVGCSVHWRPLHLHPYYESTFGWREEQLPVASAQWQRILSLPLFPDMREEELGHVIDSVRLLCERYARG
ncbi:MAG: DegT/DnrJ/EryC1/StrS family aminotransferase [Aureliella sp.]